MAFSPAGELWEVEHGPRGGDELNLIEKGKNYGWPLASFGKNYNEVPIPSHDSRPEFAKPVLYWVPVIAPGNLMFYRGKQTFPQWDGSGFISGLGSMSLNRIVFDGKAAELEAQKAEMQKDQIESDLDIAGIKEKEKRAAETRKKLEPGTVATPRLRTRWRAKVTSSSLVNASIPAIT